MFPSKRILLLTTNHVGNNLFCTAGIRLLKRHLPHLEIDVVALSFRGARVFMHNPDVHRVYLRAWKLGVRRLVDKYDLIIGLHHDIWRPFLEGVCKNFVIIEPPSPDAHRAEAVLQFVQSLIGCQLTEIDRHYVLYPQPEDFAKIDRYLAVGGQDDILVGLHLGSGRTAAHGWRFWNAYRDSDPRIWPIEYYLALTTMLRAANPRVQFVITGSRNERFLSRRFTKLVPNVINLVGKTSLLELAALMRRVRVFVTHDNGVLHVACAIGVRLVGLFGPTQPHQTGPYPHRLQHVVLKKPKITDIHPEEVYAAILMLLGK